MLSLLLLLGFAVSAFSERCPSFAETTPCVCKNFRRIGKIRVICKNEDNSLQPDDLAMPLKNLIGKQNVEMEIEGFDMTKIPLNVFEGITIISLKFQNCTLPDITEFDQAVLVGLENSLEELTVHQSINEDNDHSKLKFGHLRKLKNLDFSFNDITEITNSWFEDSTLERITLKENGIKRLGDRAFASASNLKYLYLDDNEFGPLKRSMLPDPADHLSTLELMYNKFTSLEEDIFSNMPALSEIWLQGNEISTLEQVTWEPVWEQIYLLDLDDNPIQCDSDLEWLFCLRSPDILGICGGPGDTEGRKIDSFIRNGRRKHCLLSPTV